MEGLYHHQSQTCPTRAMKWLTLVWLATAAAADDQCDGPVLQLQLRNGKDTPPRTLYGVLATFGGVPLFNMSQPAQLVAASPLDACSPLQQSEGMCVLCMCVCLCAELMLASSPQPCGGQSQHSMLCPQQPYDG